MNSAKVNDRSKKIAKKLIKRVLSTSIENPNNPESVFLASPGSPPFLFLFAHRLTCRATRLLRSNETRKKERNDGRNDGRTEERTNVKVEIVI